MEICLLVSAGVVALFVTAFCGSHDGTNSVAFTFNLDMGWLTSWSQLSGAPPDDILELKNRWKSRLINVFQLNAAWTTSYTRWKAKSFTELFEGTNLKTFGFFGETSLKWLSDHKRSLACDFSLVWDFWLCSRQYFRLLSCSRIILLDLINLLCLIWDSDSFILIEPHWDSWRRIRRILGKRTLLARIGGMRLKSHFLKRCSLSERLKTRIVQNCRSMYLIIWFVHFSHFTHSENWYAFKIKAINFNQNGSPLNGVCSNDLQKSWPCF